MPDHVTEDPAAPVQLHLHRGLGLFYGFLGVVVFGIVVAGIATYLGSGRWLLALAITVFGLGIAGFLVVLSLAMVLPVLRVGRTGVAGRKSWGRPFDLSWEMITIDVDEESTPGRLILDVGGESVTITAWSWVGFSDFVLLVACTPAAAGRLTPAARTEISRYLRLDAPAPRPDSGMTD